MLKVFLVEDEFVVREGIKNKIDWNAHGYEFCGEAGDGEVAFPMIQKLRPDIVITDIKMPFMDGLTLIKLYGWNLRAQKPAGYTKAEGREYMEQILKEHDDINVVYCENDNEAFGAIEAIEAAGKTLGSDIEAGEIMVLSFDGVNEAALEYVTLGKISCIEECNPLHGPRVKEIIEMIESGATPEKFYYVQEQIYSSYTDIKLIPLNDTVYDVTILEQKQEDTEE